MENLEGYAAELLANKPLCRRLLQLQSVSETRRAGNAQTTAGRIAVNDEVRLKGLQKAPELNGKTGIVLRKEEDSPDSRWIVKLADSSRELNIKEQNLENTQPPMETEPEFASGDKVTVNGILKAPELNGTSVTLVSRREDGRWVVRTEGGKEVALKSENLSPLTGDPEAIWECSDERQALLIVGRTRKPAFDEKDCCAVVELACRGSKNVENWCTNFTARLAPLQIGPVEVRCHEGFGVAYGTLQAALHEGINQSLQAHNIQRDKPVRAYVCGHSLGAALATLAAYDLATTGGYDVRSITFGGPRVGDEQFVDAFNSAVHHTARFLDRADAIPRIPTNPADPFDDGPILNEQLSQFLNRRQERIGAHEYFHVCKGTKLGRHNALNHTLECVNAALDSGMSAGFGQFFKNHHFHMYADWINKYLDDDPSIREVENPSADTAKLVNGIASSLGRAWQGFQQSRNNNSPQPPSPQQNYGQS